MDIQQYANYYKEKGVFSYPSRKDLTNQDWQRDYKNIDVSNITFNKCIDWEAAKKEEHPHLSGIAGVAGKMCIQIDVSGLSEGDIRNVVEHTLCELFNTNRYPWVIREVNRLYFIIDCGMPRKLEKHEVSDKITIYIRHRFPLPIDGSTEKFYLEGIPTIKPKPILYEELPRKMEKLDTYIKYLLKHKGSDKPALLKELAFYSSKERKESVAAYNLDLSVEEYREYKKKEEKLLHKYQKKLKRKKAIWEYLDKYGTTIICIVVAILTILMAISATIGKIILILLWIVAALVITEGMLHEGAYSPNKKKVSWTIKILAFITALAMTSIPYIAYCIIHYLV